MSDGILLDTHISIWLTAETLPESSLAIIIGASLDGRAFVSPATAWEVGTLTRKGRLSFHPDPISWYDRLLRDFGLLETALTSRMLLDSQLLPGNLHGDPADRMLIATSRALDCTLMTHDKAILAYAAQGHVKAIAC